MVCRGDGQSIHSLKLLLEIEEKYPVSIEVIEIGDKPICKELVTRKELKYTYYPASLQSYTYYRLSIAEAVSNRPEAFIVMPDTLEDLAAYVLNEVLLGKLQGLLLDAKYRTAYPQSHISIKAIAALGYQPSKPPSEVWSLLSRLERSTPTILYSTVKTLSTLTLKIREKYKTLQTQNNNAP